MSVATGKAIASALFGIGEDGDAENSQSYGLTREMELTCDTNTVLQIRLDLDDYSGTDDPVIGITLGYSAGTFTVNTGTEVVTTSINHGRSVGDEFVPANSGGALPAAITAGNTYYVISTPAANTLTISTEPGGSSVNFTDTGTGTHSFKAYGTSGGVQVTFDAYLGGIGEPANPEVTIKDQRSGERDDFENIRSLMAVILPTDRTAAASGLITIEGGDSSGENSYFRFDLKLNALADTGHSSFAVFCLPEGWDYADANKITVTVLECSNLSVMLNLLGR